MAIDSTRLGADSANTLSKLFTSLNATDRTEIADLFALMHQHRVPRGDVLFRPGVSCERFAVVIEGAVSVSLLDGMREKVLYTVEPGQLCVHTLTNLLNDREYQATAVAQVETQLGWMDAESFRAHYQASHAFQRLIVASLSERCFHFVRDIHDLCFRSIESRLAECLIQQAGHDSAVRLSHNQLAAYLGSTREVISRQLKAFVAAGLCRVQRGCIEILDIEQLYART
jgi:CRP/FNR family transcriptional regulator